MLFRSFAEVRIVRTGASAQHAEATLTWTSTTFSTTNVNRELAENNGVANVLALKGGARRVGAHTNNSFTANVQPVP